MKGRCCRDDCYRWVGILGVVRLSVYMILLKRTIEKIQFEMVFLL